MEDERPDGWGVCAYCGEDCAEDEYNQETRESLHVECAKFLDNREGPEPEQLPTIREGYEQAVREKVGLR